MGEEKDDQLVNHQFGGAWTEIKLDAVEHYLKLYTNALRSLPFDLWYIDGFAGSGSRTVEVESGGLFDGGPLRTTTEQLAGSAKRALNVEPSFDGYVFIEENRRRFKALEALKEEFPEKAIYCIDGNANAELQAMCESNWLKSKRSRRIVVFLDPYALQVEWSTLTSLARSRIADVWYLFPIRDVTRQLARDFDAIDAHKTNALNRVLGPDWRELYETRTDRVYSLFDQIEIETTHTFRRAQQLDIEHWFKGRLSGIFQWCSEPLPLLSDNGRQIFSLFLAISNPSRPAIDLAKRFEQSVRKSVAR